MLLLRRLPWILLISRAIPTLRDWPSALFLGWFGPIGIASLFYAGLATGKTDLHTPWLLASLMIFASVIAHGVTAAPLTRWYGRKTGYAEQ